MEQSQAAIDRIFYILPVTSTLAVKAKHTKCEMGVSTKLRKSGLCEQPVRHLLINGVRNGELSIQFICAECALVTTRNGMTVNKKQTVYPLVFEADSK